MDELTKIAEALGLDASADEAKILEAITTVQAERDTAKSDLDSVSLEDRAKEEGKIVIEADQLKALSDRVADSEAKLADADFDRVYGDALRDHKVDAKDETRERYRKLFDQDRDTTVELLDNAQPLVNSKPAGEGGSDEIEDTDSNVDPEMAKLNKKVKSYQRENAGVSYADALTAVQADEEGDLI